MELGIKGKLFLMLWRLVTRLLDLGLVGEHAGECQGRQALGAHEVKQAMKDVSVKAPLCQHGLCSINPEV
jgi:hypothetical protein